MIDIKPAPSIGAANSMWAGFTEARSPVSGATGNLWMHNAVVSDDRPHSNSNADA